MKHKNIFFTLAAMVLLTGCSEDVEQGGGQVNVPVSVVTSGCSEYKSTGDPVAFAAPMRAASNLYTSATGFDGGEKVRVAMNHPATPQTAIFDVAAPVGTDKKSELTLAATEAAPIYYPGAASGTVKIYGMYPTSMTHTVKYDQSSTSMVGNANYKASDLMFGVTDVAWTSMAEKNTLKPNIEFQHQLVKLTLTVVKKEGVKQLQEIRLHNVKRQVEITAFSADGLTLGTPVSPTDESASDGDNKDEIVITGAQAAAADADKTYSFSCVFPAQAWNDGGNAADFLTIKADDYTHTYQLLRDSWTPGTDYQLAINLLPVEADMTASITDWTTDTSYSFDFEGGLKLMPVRVEPTAIDNLHYNGAAQELVNPGTTIGGTLYYYCSTTNSRPAADAAGWSTAIPTGTERGDYYVWTKVVGNAQYFDLDVSETPVTATIGNPFAGLTAAPAPVSNLQYTGAAQPLITAGTADGGTLKYAVTTDAPAPSRMLGSLPDGNRAAPATEDFSEDIPTGTEIGTYYVWYYIEADADHASTDPVMLDPISIGKATATVTTAPTAKDLSTDLVNPGVADGGTMYYYLATTNTSAPATTESGWSSIIPQGQEDGTYYIYYYVMGDENHLDSEVFGPIEVSYGLTSGVALVDAAVGYIVADDGKAYPTSDKVAVQSYHTIVGMVACKYDSNQHGIVVAKEDAAGLKTFYNASDYNVAAGSFYINDLTTKTDKNWICGSAPQFQSAGSGTWTTAAVSGSTSFPYNDFYNKLSTAGCTPLNTARKYQTTSSYDSGSGWVYDNISKRFTTQSNGTYTSSYIRPLFVF